MMNSIVCDKPVRVDTAYFCVSDMLNPVYVENLALAFHVECFQRIFFVTRKNTLEVSAGFCSI